MNKEQLEEKMRRGNPEWWERTSGWLGRKNVYRCDTCKGQIVTQDIDVGVTPMFLACRVTEGCKGSMVSAMYSCDDSLTPTHEWYRPKKERKLPPEARDHWRQGGLFLREVA